VDRFALLLLCLSALPACQFDPNGTLDQDDARAPEPDARPLLHPDAAPLPDAAPPPRPDAAVASCPAGYTASEQTRTAYRYVPTPILWAAAESACEAEGTHLATITDSDERNVVTHALGKSPPGTSDKVWIGMSDRTSEGTWRFVTGGVVQTGQQFWNDNEPNASGDCGALYRKNDAVPSREGRYDDADCTMLGINAGYVCECDGDAVDPTAF
jgi:hypothetical protein